MVELQLTFDEATMRRYHGRGASPVFHIHWTHNQVAYPEENWVDFGSVILGWWLNAVKRLLQGSPQEELLFMDGPYSLMVRRLEQGPMVRIIPKSVDEQWEVPLHSLVQQLTNAADSVCQEFRRLGIAEQDQHGLTTLASELQLLVGQ